MYYTEEAEAAIKVRVRAWKSAREKEITLWPKIE